MHPNNAATHQNMSLRSNGADWERSLRKILMWLQGTNFCINCTSSPSFALSFMQLWNDPKCTQTLYNAPKHEFRVQWGGSIPFIAKNPNATSRNQLFALVVPVQPVLYRALCSNKTIQNASKHNRMHQNMSLGPNGVDRVHSLRKILMRLRGKNFCINCTSPARFAPSFVQ